MRETNGCCIDAIVNSLAGELLDPSWRIMADGGTMVEMGKRDIADGNTLAMQPFDRNCSFRDVDLSYTKHFNAVIEARFASDFRCLAKRAISHVKPIHLVTTYGFKDVPSALALIRNGCHIGKVVITNNDREIIVPTRPAIRRVRLSPVVSHLIAGSLKGLCSTLAVHIAQYGARRIVVSNRNRISDEASAEIVRDCMSYGCRVTEAKDDIGNMNFVKGLVQNTFPRIGGIAQAAMALNDMSYESMTQEQYQNTIYWRQFQDLFANSVELGSIKDVGYVAEDETGLDAKINRAH
ncbi:hypothetical protein AFLA70_292g001331 [Aspergillus flavus AF70]|nr:hypothetical protein AFLA70_292g001331 [Aspergillus flavus AF70]